MILQHLMVIFILWSSYTVGQERPCDYPEIENGFIYKPYWQAEKYYRSLFPQSIGEIMYYRCNENYVPAQGSSSDYWTTFSCTEEGWSPVPECIEEVGKCGPPPPINNGDITSFALHEYAPGSRVEYRCQKYYVLQGSPIVTCRNGLWTKEPTCLETCTISKEMMMKNNIELKWVDAEKIYSKTGEMTEFVCIRGFRKAPRSPPFRARCTKGNINYPRCI
ncbi:complement factor H-related protein 2-like [Trichosurus vulpecula]|uniref:complement factor H-related protein 2-like n=1 Tax=Trichosurus vulpecula TaxID=9337 RepID=UPI00186B4225|nr:complement factor H-related protein 2-like [Trichosurus vulpecula]